jgi:hypothetical protein
LAVEDAETLQAAIKKCEDEGYVNLTPGLGVATKDPHQVRADAFAVLTILESLIVKYCERNGLGAKEIARDAPGSIPLALTTDEVLKQLTDNLQGCSVANRKAARAWCDARGIPSYSRDKWKQTFGVDPPIRRGRPAFHNSADVLRAIAAENEAAERSGSAKVESQDRARIIRQPQYDPESDADNF